MGSKGTYSRESYLRSSLFVISGLLLSQISEIGKDLTIAWKYGATRFTDAYFVAISIPMITYAILLLSSQMVLVPIFTKLTIEKENDKILKLFNDIFWIALGILICYGYAIYFFADNIIISIAPGFMQDAREIATYNLRVLVWTILPFGLISQSLSLLRSKRYFFIPSSLKLIGNIAFIFIVSVIPIRSNSLIIAAYSMFICQTIYLLGFFRKIIPSLGIPINLFNKKSISVLKLYAFPLMSIFLSQLVMVTERFFASSLGSGKLSLAAYTARVFTGIVGLLGGTIIGTAIPVLSKLFKTKDNKYIQDVVNLNLKLVLLISLPLTVCLITFSESAIHLLFSEKVFSAEQMLLASRLLSLYGAGLLFSCMMSLTVAIFSSHSFYKMVLVQSSLFIFINFSINFIFVQWIGIYSLPISRVMSNCLTVAISLYFLKIKNKVVFNRGLVIFIAKLLCSCGLMFIVIMAAKFILSQIDLKNLRFYSMWMVSVECVGIIIFVLTCMLLEVKEIFLLKNVIWGKPFFRDRE